MKNQKGFSLIELMVVVVIIGILAALAIPKMLGISAKAKAAEAPTAIANYENLQSAHVNETGALGTGTQIGYNMGTSKWWSAPTTTTAGTISMVATIDIGTGCVIGNGVQSVGTLANADVTYAHSASGGGTCMTMMKNF